MRHVTKLKYRTEVEDEFIENQKTVIFNNLSDPDFNVNVLSKKVFMSRMNLHRKVKALTKLSTGEFIRAYKIEQAKSMLKTRKVSILEISEALGFSDSQYFSRVFKKATKQTPTDFIKTIDN